VAAMQLDLSAGSTAVAWLVASSVTQGGILLATGGGYAVRHSRPYRQRLPPSARMSPTLSHLNERGKAFAAKSSRRCWRRELRIAQSL
jgi:hypothetical protein